MTDNCKSCSWFCPVEHVCLLGYFDCLKELEEEYKEEIKEDLEQ